MIAAQSAGSHQRGYIIIWGYYTTGLLYNNNIITNGPSRLAPQTVRSVPLGARGGAWTTSIFGVPKADEPFILRNNVSGF